MYNLKLSLRFLGELANANVVGPDAIFAIFQKLLSDGIPKPFLNFSHHAENTGQQGRRDFFTMTVMEALPYVGHTLFKADASKLSDLFDLLNIKTANRDNVRSSSPFHSDSFANL